MKGLRLLAVVVCVAALFAASASAITYTWDFSGTPAGDVGSADHTYTVPISITAHGRASANSAPSSPSLGDTWITGAVSDTNLFGKEDASAVEDGLGLTDQVDNEIDQFHFIQLDVTPFLSKFNPLSLAVASIQSGEGFYLWGSNALGVPGVLLHIGGNPSTGGDIQTLSVPDWGTYDFYSVSATPAPANGASNVIIEDTTSISLIPEPATLSLLAVGGGAALLRRRKQTAK